MRVRMVDYLIDRIYEMGAHHVFFVPGTGCMFLTDALARKKELEAISVHHEQAAGMAAITYAKCNNTIGACVLTTGCGGTNAITATLHAFQDNVPCIFISGQAARHQTLHNLGLPIRQMGRQETDIIKIVKPITKYAVMINDPADVKKNIDEALYRMNAGRKGPVWIDVPMDIQNCIVETDDLEPFVIPKDNDITPIYSTEDVKYVLDALKDSKRPVILAGNGIRLGDAIPQFLDFCNKYQIPVCYSKLGHDLLLTNNDLSIGMVGMLGSSRAGNFAVANSDLLLSFGCRLSIDTTGYEYDKFAREAKTIVVDIDEVEHQKNTVAIDRVIHSDIKSFLQAMNKEAFSTDFSEWRNKCKHWKETMPTPSWDYTHGELIDMYYFAEQVSAVMPEDATVITSAGNTLFTISPVLNISSHNQRSITSGGQAEMGYPLPAAIGASFARKGVIIAIDGDGSFMMNIQELETLSHLKRNVKLFIMNNNGYSSIRHLQQNSFRGREIGCDAEHGCSFPDFGRVTEAFNLPYVKIKGSDNLAEKIDAVLKMEGPVICDVMCVPDQKFLNVSLAMNSKKKFVNRPLEDQAPFLDRDVINKEMIITPLD